MYNRLRQAVSDTSGNSETLSGVLGYTVAGVFRVVDPDDPRKFYVRFPNGNWVSALHYNRVPQTPGRGVIVSTDNLGRPYIIGEDKSTASSFNPPGSGGSAVGWHTHVRGSGLEYINDSWLIKQFRVAPITGTLGVSIAAGSYIYNRSLSWYAGGTLDLTSYLPTLTDAAIPLIIALDPVAGTPIVLAGSSGLTTITNDLIATIPCYELGYLPLASLWLQTGDSSIPTYRFENLTYRQGGAAWYLEDLFNVSSDSDYNGYVLTYESGYWVGKPPSSGGGGGGGGSFPVTASIWRDEFSVVTGSAFIWGNETGQFGEHVYTQSSPANGNASEAKFFIAAGTYTMYALGFTSAGCGLVDWTIDGSSIATGQDWYSAVNTANVIKSTPSIVISADGTHTLRATINGKNASSSGYAFNLTKAYFRS